MLLTQICSATVETADTKAARALLAQPGGLA
jgi:hypothetical protein